MYFSKKFISATNEMSTLFDSVPAPYLRRSFVLETTPKAASITICGLGFYELFVNGNRITKGLLSPYINNPNHILYYDDYDILPYITEGENVVGIILGNGMQNCFGGYVWDFDKADWRTSPKVALFAEFALPDNTKLQIEADENFLCASSPIIYDDLRMGERYDARREICGWDLPEFDTTSWSKALIAETPRGRALHCLALPIKPWKELKPIKIWEEEDGYIYDFGENAAGLCRLTLQGEEGQVVTLVHGEYIKDGKFYYDNIRFVRKEYESLPLYLQLDEYICKGNSKESYMPHFTYHGFRYVKVTGITKEQATKDLLTYVVMNTELNERGNFHCSDEMINQLQSMTRVSTLANFYHFPTDCPHREKNGWTADAALSAEHTLLNLEPDINYREWMRNICSAMNNEGAIPGIVPTGEWGFEWGNGPAWDSVLVTIPYYMYIYRGDLVIAKETASYLWRYIHYLTTKTDENGLIAIGLGDWCSPTEPAKSPLIFTDTTVSMDICRKAAVLFDAMDMKLQGEFCRTVSNGFKDAIRKHLLDDRTMTLAGNCQTSQAMAIYYDVLEEDEKPKAVQVLLQKIKEMDEHIDCGVLGARVLFHVLSEYGYIDLAYHMITRLDAPSYGEWIVRGETALAESFKTEEQGIDSRNHHFFGDISGWFIKSICGINLNPDLMGVDTILISPHFPKALSYAKGYHMAPKGEIKVEWEKSDLNIFLTLKVPDEMNGDLILPNGLKFPNGERKHTAKSGTYIIIDEHS